MTVIGIDIGTYESKGVVVNDQGQVIASAVRVHRLSVPQPGYAEHDAQHVWWEGLVELVRTLLASPDVDLASVAAICCSGIGPCVLPIDEDGRPLRPAILYGLDTRAAAQIAWLNAELGESAILARGGNPLTSQSAGPKIAWLRDEEPEIHASARMFVTSSSYLVGRLTGRWVIDHGTAGYFHPLYNLDEQRWDTRGCESFVTQAKLPELMWAGEIAGGVTAAAAGETGLPEGVPVLVGTADALVEALSCGVQEPGDMMLMYGSSHFMIQVTAVPTDASNLYTAPYLFDGTFVAAAGTSTAGTITRWFIDMLGMDHSVSNEAFERLAHEALQSPPGAGGLLVLPHFSGERIPLDDPLATGALFGLTLSHSRADVYRALLEGIAQGVRAALDVYEGAGITPQRLRAVGGGTKNEVWISAVSDVTGLPQHVVSGLGACYGDAMLAALAIGLVPDREALAAWVTLDRVVEPRTEFGALYARQSQLWDQLQSVTLGISHSLRDPGTALAGGQR